MSKKSKRRRKRRRTPRLSPAQLVQPGVAAPMQPVQTAERPVVAPAATPEPAGDLREEYRYVVADLRRIAIIAAAMMVLMIVLALLIV